MDSGSDKHMNGCMNDQAGGCADGAGDCQCGERHGRQFAGRLSAEPVVLCGGTQGHGRWNGGRDGGVGEGGGEAAGRSEAGDGIGMESAGKEGRR